MAVADFCCLELHLNREFSIKFEGQNDQAVGQDDYGMFDARSKEPDVTSIIDGASAILSKNGGHVVSVRSSYLADMTSIHTPRSHVASQRSIQNSVISKPHEWSKYRGKSKQPKNDD